MDGSRSALIVASDTYQDPGLRQLRAPASDAQALAAVLRDPRIGGFEVRTLLNEPAHEVNLAVEELFVDRRPDDLLLLHFSCHGVKDEGGELFFATVNTKLGRLGSTAVAADFVNRRMSRSRSRRVVLLLDCCYAGAFERGMTARAGTGMGIEEQFGGRGRAVITASSAMEYAFEGDELADTQELAPSVFTSALVEGLETGEADRDQDGMVALDELYDYIHDKVQAATPHQTPGKWTFGVQGDLYIARRSRPVTTPAPLPPELQQGIDSPLAAVRAGAVQELARLLQSRHAGLALAARTTLERLTEDDSRTVAAAATTMLSAQAPPQPAPPKLALSATVVDFGRLPQHSTSPEQRVRLSNAGGGTLNARAATQASWLKLHQVGDELVVGVDTTVTGRNEDTISIDSDGGSATIRVQAQVDSKPLPAAGTAVTTHPRAEPELPEDARSGAQQDAARSKAAPAPAAAAPVVPPAATGNEKVVTVTAATEDAAAEVGTSERGPAPPPRPTSAKSTFSMVKKSTPGSGRQERKSWIPWAVGVVAVVSLVIAVILQAGGTERPTSPRSDSPTRSTSSASPTTASSASPTTAPTVLASDDFRATAPWRVSVRTHGKECYITIWKAPYKENSEPILDKSGSKDYSIAVSQSGLFWIGADKGCTVSVRDKNGNVRIVF